MAAARTDYLLLDFRAYRRKFARPWVTGRGVWAAREGVIVCLTDAAGRQGFGEAAPIPTFTSETAARDLLWLRRAPDEISPAELHRVPARLACLRWAFYCAMEMLEAKLQPSAKIKSLPVAALLPVGREGLPALAHRAAEGYRVFKWKIGLAAPPEEFSLLEKLLAALPKDGRLRLDANGSLSRREWSAWCDGLNTLGAAGSAIEFFEQPLPPATGLSCWREQARLAAVAPVPVALDESVAGWPGLRKAGVVNWPGPLVVKPSLLGATGEFMAWRSKTHADLIYSSACETSVGLYAALCLASEDPLAGKRALGFGTLEAFGDDGLQLPGHKPGASLTLKKLSSADFVGIWNRLAP